MTSSSLVATAVALGLLSCSSDTSAPPAGGGFASDDASSDGTGAGGSQAVDSGSGDASALDGAGPIHAEAGSGFGNASAGDSGAVDSSAQGGGVDSGSGTSALDSGASDGASSGAGGMTTSGVALPQGWSLKVSDRFGLGAASTVSTLGALHARYYEAQYYNRDSQGLVQIPNVVINGEQETYSHFENVIVFSSDHLTIQGRGHPDGSITSGELVSVRTARSFCTEARYKIPSADKSWPAFWFYAATSGGDTSELDVEQPITPSQGVHDVTMYNHPDATSVAIVDGKFSTSYMTWTSSAFDGSAAPHDYTTCYDDGAAKVSRFIDGKAIYTAPWKWNASLGGTGHGPDAATIVNLAVGGSWPGNTPNPAGYSADLDLYSIEYYGP